MTKKEIHLYPDRPELTGELKFAHKVQADWLENLISQIQPPFRLALTGPLGAGKSTVIHNALAKLEKKKDQYAVAYVDVWKLDQTSARRSTILRVAKEFKINLDSDRYKKLHRSMYGSVNAIDDVKVLDTLANNISWTKQPVFWFIGILSILLGFLVYFIVKDLTVAGGVPEIFKIILGAVVSAALFLSNIVSQKILQVKSSVSQAPFVGPEEFENAFQTLLDAPEVSGKKAIVIFDNIDRAPKSKTEEILTGISAFFDHSSHGTFRDLIIIVPFSNKANNELTEVTVQKFFDAVVPMPNLMPEDLMDFTRDKFVGVGWDKEADDIAQLVDRSDLKTPRSILHLVNEMIAQTSLAETLESETYKDEADNVVTFLPKGSVTANKVFYAKVKLCEKIYSNFIFDATVDFLSPSEAFSSERYKSVDPTDPFHAAKIRLYEFLRATENVPEKMPESLEQFIYFKGSDLELSVPGSSTLVQAMNNRSEEEIRQFFDKENDINSLEKLFVFNLAKNRRNPLRVKNSILSILESFDDEVPSFTFRKELAKSLVKLPNVLAEVDIQEICKITPETDGYLENEFLWKEIDGIYKELKKEEGGTTEELEEWKEEYLLAVLKQSTGVQRAELNSTDFKATYLSNEELFKELSKDDGLKKYVGASNTGAIFDFLIQKEFSFNKLTLENFGKALNVGINNMGTDQVGTTQEYFNRTWSLIAGKILDREALRVLFVNILHHFKNINKSAKCPETCWDFFGNLNNQHAQFNNINQVAEKEFVSLLILINSRVRIDKWPNLANVLKSYIAKAEFKNLAEITSLFGNWIWFKPLSEVFPDEIEALIKKKELTAELVMKESASMTAYFKTKIVTIAELDNFEEIFEKLKDHSDYHLSKLDISQACALDSASFSFTVDKLVFSFLKRSKHFLKDIESEKWFRNLLISLKSEKDLDVVISWAKELEVSLLPILNEYKDELEGEEKKAWGADDSLNFYILVSGSEGRTRDFYEGMFDKAIERGVFSGTEAEAVKRVSNVLLNAWGNKKGVKVDLLKSYMEGLAATTLLTGEEKDSFTNSLEAVARNNKLLTELGFVKPSIKDKIAETISSITKKD